MSSVLIHSPNWLGDVIMVLPALQAFHRHNPDVELGLVCKSSVAGIWKQSEVPFRLHVLSSAGLGELFRAGREIREHKYERAILAAHTPRAALLVRVGGVTKQRSFRRGITSFLVSDPISRPSASQVVVCFLTLGC